MIIFYVSYLIACLLQKINKRANSIHLYIEPALVNSKNNIIYSCIEFYNVFSYNADQDEITLGQIIDVVSLQEINANLDSVLPHQSIKVPCLHICQ